MYTKKEFFFSSACGTTQIHAVTYLPSCEIKGILQITHGMMEYIERYEEFAHYLTDHGFLVTGHDHLGHGASVNSPEDLGYFCAHQGNHVLIQDIFQLMELTQKQYPSIPYFLLGHSMGSFYVRQFICHYGHRLTGAIIMGTGFQPLFLVSAGKFLCTCIAGFKGFKYRSPFINKMAIGSYNRSFSSCPDGRDWLTKDKEKVREYLAEPRCNFTFTLNAYYNMFLGISKLYQKELLEQIPKNLPLLVTSGARDPVGDFSKGVLAFVESLKKLDLMNITLKLYENDRHEILNETDRETVYEDILHWMTSFTFTNTNAG